MAFPRGICHEFCARGATGLCVIGQGSENQPCALTALMGLLLWDTTCRCWKSTSPMLESSTLNRHRRQRSL